MNKTEKDRRPRLSIVRKFNVPPDVVFDAFTDPETMRIWWTDDTTFDIDLRIDGRWTIRRTEGDTEYVMTGKYLEIDRPHRLVYSIGMPQFSPNYDTVSIRIEPVGNNGSILTFEQTGDDITAELEDLSGKAVSESEKGWQQGFDLMAKAWANNE